RGARAGGTGPAGTRGSPPGRAVLPGSAGRSPTPGGGPRGGPGGGGGGRGGRTGRSAARPPPFRLREVGYHQAPRLRPPAAPAKSEISQTIARTTATMKSQ